MVVARSTSRSVATTTLNKPPKVKSAKDVVDDRQLAEDVDRVLRISQPKEAALTIKPRRPDASTVASSSKPRAHSPATKVVKPAIPPASNKGKEKATPDDERSPWKAERLSSAERAKAAMQAINDGIKSLNQAVQAGYRHGSGKRIEEWTEQRVMAAVETCEEALRSLRVQEEKGELGSKGIEVERAAQGLVGKCLGLAMVRPSPKLLRLLMNGS